MKKVTKFLSVLLSGAVLLSAVNSVAATPEQPQAQTKQQKKRCKRADDAT